MHIVKPSGQYFHSKLNLVPFLFFLLISLMSGCSSGGSNPVVPASDDISWKPPEKKITSGFELPIEIDPLSETRTAAGANIRVAVQNLDYDINAGWASFDLAVVNSGQALFDVYLNIERIIPQGEMVVDEWNISNLKYGIIARGVTSSSRHIDITFPAGTTPKLMGSMTGKTSPMFMNERTVLHTDKFADHAHDYSSFSGRIIADQVLIRFMEDVSLNDQYTILDSYRLIPVGVNLSNRFIQADILDGRHPDDVVDNLMRNPSINHAEVNTINFLTFYPDDPIFDPDDPAWGEDGINSWGQRRIQGPEAWDFYHDRTLDEVGDIDVAYDTNAPIVMFICDTGYKYHEDLAIDAEDEVWLNMGLNIVDPEEFPVDDNGHGTYISGIAMAEGNNQTGMAGVAWNARIVPIKTNDHAGMGDEFRSGAAISYAKEIALDYPEYRCVGNMSYGTHSQNHEVDRVNEASAFIDALPVANLQFVAAAGNCANTPNEDPAHPCYYDFELSANNHFPSGFPWTIGVGASRGAQDAGQDKEAGFSNWGWTIDVSAPGVEIYTTHKETESSYKRVSGTSCSSPFTAGLFALIWSRNPTLTKSEIRHLIRATADPMSLPPHKVGKMGTGRINAFKAMFAAEYLKPPVGEKICSGDLEGDGIDETALGLNGSFRNTGIMLVFDSFNHEMTHGGLKFDTETDRLITDSVFGDITGDGDDEVIVSILADPGGLYEITEPTNTLNLFYIDYTYQNFTVNPLYEFAGNTSSEHITSGDITGDGTSEIVVALQTNPSGYFAIRTPTNDLSVEIIDNDGSVLASIPVGVDKLATEITTGDIDDDGYDEILLAYVDDPAGVYAIDGGTNTGNLLILDDADAGYVEIHNVYIPQADRIIEQILAVNLDDDLPYEFVIATLDYPSGYLENVTVANNASLIAYEDIVKGTEEIAGIEFGDNRKTFVLTDGNVHPGTGDDKFWAWFMLNPIDVYYVDGETGGSLLMVPYGVEDGQFVEQGLTASSANGYCHFSGCTRNGDFDNPDEFNETALYAIEGGQFSATRYFEYHDDIGDNLYITWEYDFPPMFKHFELYRTDTSGEEIYPDEP